MLVLISGGVRSGKSTLAETKVKQQRHPNGTNHYFATARVTDTEMEARIRKHQEDRGEAFTTSEVPFFTYDQVAEQVARQDTVLFECLTLYVANVLFSTEAFNGHVPTTQMLVNELVKLSQNVHLLVIVTNDVFREDYRLYEQETLRYLEFLASVMKGLADHADEVYEVYYGLERRLK